MKNFNVTVEKMYRVSGVITVKANSPEEANDKIDDKILSGKLQTNDPKINWGDMDYEDSSFKTTGDVN